jgi:hypothetical protein
MTESFLKFLGGRYFLFEIIILSLTIMTSSCNSKKENQLLGKWELVSMYIGTKKNMLNFDSTETALLPNEEENVIEFTKNYKYTSKNYGLNPPKLISEGFYNLVGTKKLIFGNDSIQSIKDYTDSVEYLIFKDTLIIVVQQEFPDSIVSSKYIKLKNDKLLKLIRKKSISGRDYFNYSN